MIIVDKLRENRRSKINRKRVEQILQQLSQLAGIAEPEECLPVEKELMGAILALSPAEKKENNPVLQPLHLYFSGLYQKGRISLDRSASNASISLFTKTFLKKDKEIKQRFYFYSLQKVIMMLMLSNLSVHRPQAARRLHRKYRGIFTETYKARMYLRLFGATCGLVDIDYVYDLFGKAAATFRDTCSTLHERAEFLCNIFMISQCVQIDVPDMPEIIKSFSSMSAGQRGTNIVSVYREFCLANQYLDEVEAWLDSLEGVEMESQARHAVQEVRTLLEGRRAGLAEIPRLPKPEQDTQPAYIQSQITRHYADKGYDLKKLEEDIEAGIRFYEEQAHSADSLDARLQASNTYYSLQLMLPSVRYWRDYETNYHKVPLGEEVKGDTVFVFVNEYSLVNGAVTFPFLLEARRRGIPCFSFSPRIHLDTSEAFDDFYGWAIGGIDSRFYQDNDISATEIDIPGKRIMVEGLNVYQPIFEFVSRYQFTYNYNFEGDAWARSRTIYLIRVYQAMFRYLKKLEAWAQKEGKKVFFISNAPHIHNAAAFRIYCEEEGHKHGLEYICTSPGYDNYFLNASDPRSETTTALNMTRHLEARNSFLGTREGFERYYEKNKYRMHEIREKMQVHLEAQRGRDRQRALSEEKSQVLERIQTAKADGKKILLLNGKVIIDLAVKYTKGCVHSDMSEWITHAVEFAGRHQDSVLLLVKPHPHENREDLTLTSEKIDNLRSLIRCDLNDATIYLDNDMFTNSELVPYMDVGLVWNGTSSLEFAAQGKKVLVADVWGHFDYPIGFVYPKTLAEYESYLLDPSLIEEPEDISDRAITFLEYMGSDDVRVVNAYSQTTLMNFNQFESTIDAEAVDRFVAQGDKALCCRFDELI